MSFVKIKKSALKILGIVLFASTLTSCGGFYNLINTRELTVKNNFNTYVIIEYRDYLGSHSATIEAGKSADLDIVMPFTSIVVSSSGVEESLGVSGCTIEKVSSLEYVINETEVILLKIKNELDCTVSVNANPRNKNFSAVLAQNESKQAYFNESTVKYNGQYVNPFSVEGTMYDIVANNIVTYVLDPSNEERKIYYEIKNDNSDGKTFVITELQ